MKVTKQGQKPRSKIGSHDLSRSPIFELGFCFKALPILL